MMLIGRNGWKIQESQMKISSLT
ncbi:hypothetical protein Goari_011291 [Gossypium aridum]|uniref:Uncharacterized protein n=1 Tax=Gossypium aridum TaxID=34290 RepID=A0A7J8WXD0_GOSAI|nr:hypothetical protein [Gossypium aridum]